MFLRRSPYFLSNNFAECLKPKVLDVDLVLLCPELFHHPV